MNLASLAIRYRPIVVTLVVLLMIWGVYSIGNMPRREDPEYYETERTDTLVDGQIAGCLRSQIQAG